MDESASFITSLRNIALADATQARTQLRTSPHTLYKFFIVDETTDDDACCVGTESDQRPISPDEVILTCLACGEQRRCEATVAELVV